MANSPSLLRDRVCPDLPGDGTSCGACRKWAHHLLGFPSFSTGIEPRAEIGGDQGKMQNQGLHVFVSLRTKAAGYL